MAIFSSLTGFVKRHKKKLIFTLTTSVSIYYLVDYLIIRKFRNFQKSLSDELIFKKLIKQRFIQTQLDCYYTILALLPVLSTPILNHLPVENITKCLKMKKLDSSDELTQSNLTLLDSSSLLNYQNLSKKELWSLLKIKTITRTLTLIYSISSLLLISRLQLNILARKSYLESAISMAGVNQNPDIDQNSNYIIEQAYLSLSWWLLNKGWENIINLIEPIISKKFENINPKTLISINEFENLLNQVFIEIDSQILIEQIFPLNYQDLVESLLNTNPNLIDQLDNQNSNFLKLINETNHFINHNQFIIDLLKNLIITAISTLSFNLSSSLNSNDDGKFKLATFLAQLSVQNNIIIDNNNLQLDEDFDDIDGFVNSFDYDNQLSGNIYINNLNQVEDLEDFAAGIYSNYE